MIHYHRLYFCYRFTRFNNNNIHCSATVQRMVFLQNIFIGKAKQNQFFGDKSSLSFLVECTHNVASRRSLNNKHADGQRNAPIEQRLNKTQAYLASHLASLLLLLLLLRYVVGCRVRVYICGWETEAANVCEWIIACSLHERQVKTLPKPVSVSWELYLG